MSHISDLQEDLLLDAAKIHTDIVAMLVEMVRNRNTENRILVDGEACEYHRFIQVKITAIRKLAKYANTIADTFEAELSK